MTEDRRADGSVLQALGLMNDNFITSRLNSANAPRNSLLGRNRNAPADQMIDNLFLAVLSRYPTADEKKTASAQFQRIPITGTSGGEPALVALQQSGFRIQLLRAHI